MKQFMILLLIIICSSAVAMAETYKWISDQGVVSYTDNPSLIPANNRSNTVKRENKNIRSAKIQKEVRKKKTKKRHGGITTLRIVTPPDRINPTSAPKLIPQPYKGHLGGDQTDPAPPSMKQPTPAPLGDQPKPAPAGMKQPIPAPLGDQPKPTALGMKQPNPEPLGDQPTPTPLGMEQPTPKL